MKYLHKYILFLLPIFFLLISNADAQSIIHLQNWEGQAGAGGWFGFETTDNNFARGTDASGVFQGNKAIYIMKLWQMKLIYKKMLIFLQVQHIILNYLLHGNVLER
jgi:hypothetical protein